MPNWTKEQQMAISARNHTVLVSAAAGSGKTAVLIERIVSLVKEGYHIDRMLIVTFTRAAAGEMRQRLNARLTREAAREPEIYGQALDELEGADISTIHSFCQRVIKSNFQSVGIDPMARVCEENQRQQLFEQAYRSTVNGLLDEKGYPLETETRLLLDSFDQRELTEITADLYQYLMSMPDMMVWLKKQIDEMLAEPFSEHPWFRVLMNRARLEMDGAVQYLDEQERMFASIDAVQGLHATWEKDRELIERLIEASQNANEFVNALAGVKFATATRTTGLTDGETAWKEKYNEIRKEIKGIVDQVKKQLTIHEAQNSADMQRVQKLLLGLYVVITRLYEQFMQLKNENCVIDFHDLEQMTLRILQQKELREMLQKDYDHIFVDECQDVSAVQDAIVQLIHGEDSCLFMVGDVKQSIYRFRLADPTLFLTRMRTYSDEETAQERRIFLQKNFRSRTNVLDATNRVFRSAMQASVTELDYLPEDELISGRETSNDPPVEIRLVDKREKDGAAACLESETAVVVRRIRELLATPMAPGERNYQYRDMVILLAKTAGVGAKLSELLEEQGVPVYFDGKDDYYGLPEVRTVCELLRVIDNPMNDVPLLTVLKMTPFSMNEQELAEIRMCKTGKNVPFYEAFNAACAEETEIGKKCRAVRETIGEWRFRKECMRMSDFVWYLIRETGFYAACGAYPEGELRQANLRLLCQRAADYETNFDGVLSGFLQMVDQQIRAADSTGAKVLGENENLVRIMTMHKSKGLEFPVVFLMRLTASMAGRNAGTIKINNRLGVCLPYVNRDVNVKRELVGAEAFKHQRKLDEMAERCRLLYVAMTRARERLIMTGCCEAGERLAWQLKKGAYRVWAADCMMDWVMQAVTDEAGESAGQAVPWSVSVEQDVELTRQEHSADTHETMNWAKQAASVTPDSRYNWWSAIDEERRKQPIKTSVSSLARKEILGDPMPLSDADEDAEDKRQPEEIVMPLRMSEIPAMPAFMEEKKATGADRGTLMHRFLSLMPLEQVRGKQGFALTEAVYAEVGELVKQGCLDEQAAGLLDVTKLTAYFASPLGQRMLASSLVRREWAFNLCIDRKNGTLLQGVIDCVFDEDESWVLVDYKTDRFDSDEAFIMRHALQLNWYAKALEEITGKPVKELWLYSLGKNRPYPVAKQALTI